MKHYWNRHFICKITFLRIAISIGIMCLLTIRLNIPMYATLESKLYNMENKEDKVDVVEAVVPLLEQQVSESASSGKLFSGDRVRTFPEEKKIFDTHSLPAPPAAAPQPPRFSCHKWGVVTTIFSPSEAVRRFLYRPDWCVVVVGDLEKPKSYHIPTSVGQNIIFLSAEDQIKMSSRFVNFLPWKNFGRKNVGYLFAIAQGAKVIWDFDDDNMLKFWMKDASPDPVMEIDYIVQMFTTKERFQVAFPQPINHSILIPFNPYPILGCPTSPCWPRGFPLHHIRSNNTWKTTILYKQIRTRKVVILQSLADHEPDVDSIFRMVQGTPMSFLRKNGKVTTPLILPHNHISPLNAQAAIHFLPSFFALYLPVTVSGRVSDIWRSYIAQSIFRLFGLHVGFLPRPIVTQERNPHSYEADFEAEMPLYLQVRALLEFLETWTHSMNGTDRSTEDIVENLWIELYERKFVGYNDVLGIQLWLQALNLAGYILPSKTSAAVESGKRAIPLKDNINLAVGVSIAKQFSGKPGNCKNIGKRKTLWTCDLHDGTRMDLATQLASLGQRVVLAGKKDKLIQHSSVLEYDGIAFAEISPAVKTIRYHSSPLSESSIKANHKYYKKHKIINKTDAFVCSFVASMCELWKMFDRSIVFLPAHRYNLGRCYKNEFLRLNNWVEELAQNNRHVVGAMSRYDLEYMKYYLNVPQARLISSLSGLYTKGNPYQPTRKEVLLLHTVHYLAPHFVNLAAYVKEHNVVHLRKLYENFELSDLVQHPAMVILPYAVMSYKFTEFYSLGIPLFVPSIKYFFQNGGFGMDRTASSEPFCSSEAKLNQNMLKHISAAHPYSPNVDYPEDPEAEMFWLQYSDFYDWPFVQYFDNATDLVDKLARVNLTEVHLGMMESYETRQYLTMEQWCEVIPMLGHFL